MLPPVTRESCYSDMLFTIPANGRISFPGKNIENNNVTGIAQNTANQISFAPPMNGQSRPTTNVLSLNFLFMKALIADEKPNAIMKYLEITGTVLMHMKPEYLMLKLLLLYILQEYQNNTRMNLYVRLSKDTNLIFLMLLHRNVCLMQGSSLRHSQLGT